jgi:6-phospho-3-hexuloisomerase
MMDFQAWSKFYLEKQGQTLAGINPDEMENLADAILSSKRIFVLGKGRTGLVIEMFAMRLVHLGYQAYIIGQSTTPKFTPEDILILASCSGNTEGILLAARQASAAGGTIFAITRAAGSSLCDLTSHVLRIPEPPEADSAQPASKIMQGTLFEQSLLLTLDCFIAGLAEKTGQDFDKMSDRHVKIE